MEPSQPDAFASSDYGNYERDDFEKAKKFLNIFASYQNPNLSGYAHIIQSGSGYASGLETHYADRWYDLVRFDERSARVNEHKKDIQCLIEKLQGAALVDLGGGSGGCSAIFNTFPLAAYLSVDKFIYNKGRPFDSQLPVFASEEHGKMVIEIKDDMLDFVSHIQDNSACFMMNGIDTAILPNTEYWDALAEEIMRATRDGGIVFGLNPSRDLQNYFDGHQDTYRMVDMAGELDFLGDVPYFFCYEKPKEIE